ncbi:MAG: ATP-binding protein [Candidatus Midichloria sp.]|uniref:histidine kinase n=1 Tax=Hyalomma marginatum TaxID=34627 RepID=A0A8S4C454_9ACAR|nr:HAMP domain-containing protein [Hyalomma marginatum]CAG7595835.1 HAMP domain-containing protein [Hyalomma marginatum]
MFNLTIKRKVVLLMGLIVTIIPIILIATLLYSYYLFGVEHFFNTKVNEAIEETVKVAQLYLQEHKDKVKIDSLSIANNIEKNKHIIFNNKELLQLFVDQLANARGLVEIMVFQDGFVIIRNSLGLALWFENIKSEVLDKLENEEVIILEDNVENRVRAVTKIEGLPENTYVLVGRYIDQAILDHLKKTESSAKQYKLILGGLDITKHKLQTIFVCSSILLLTISVLIARRLALYITKPLEEIALATVSLRDGNFSVRVPEGEQKDEIHTLARAFNVMTEKISEQHNELVIANEVSNTRRKFIEVILAEVSVGILATNLDYEIISYNNVALDLLAVNIGPILKIEDIFPELLKLLENTKNSGFENQIDDLIIIRKNKKLHLAVKSGPVLDQNGKVESLVITFSNITDLIYNQKIAAWADVARRIAHEIKNPLTPISLAAERLKRKYSAAVETEPNSFIRYIDTIISHVGYIERMVAEFVDFAKIPDPKIKKNNLIKIIEESLLLQKVANPEITYSFDPKQDKYWVKCDYGQILRVINNLLNNATDAIKAKYSTVNLSEGKILINIKEDLKNDQLYIKIIDNGCGIKQTIIDRISEPYVTTKQHGTGLGLAIVKKIIEEHGGKFSISNIKDGAVAAFNLSFF